MKNVVKVFCIECQYFDMLRLVIQQKKKRNPMHLRIHTKSGNMIVLSFTHNDTMLSDTMVGLSFEPSSNTFLLNHRVDPHLIFQLLNQQH